ncbi:DUF6270 domain-containing protein [Priestia megaterium]|uniref:DUF6270 domain-containing protein n=1 Tax=Priestia megaterium TaxID=1404 RepID=UPI00278A93E2|nr:DUF6270 domain-containing protein [Priestia megaterium]MDQ0803475.1 hypothetical protein [Priestia megaterium]
MMKKLDILGSCVTRDALELTEESQYTLETYFARSSLISLYSPKVDIKREDIQLASDFQKEMVYYDLTKYFPRYIKETEADYLLIDFIDERMEVLERNGSYITRSNEFVHSNVNEQIQYEASVLNKEEINELWKKSALQLIEDLKGRFNPKQIILHKALWRYSYIDKNGEEQTFKEHYWIKRNNDKIDGYYEFFQENFPGIHVIDLNNQYHADEFNKWGLSPFHYEEKYYKAFIEQLNKICQ